MTLIVDADTFIKDQINTRTLDDAILRKDLIDALSLLTQETKELVAELLSRNIDKKSPISTIELEELLLESA